MKRILFLTFLILLILCTSCFETSGRGNLKIYLETPALTKSIKPDERASGIVKYNIKGIGPGGKTFSRDSSSKTVTVEGLPMGTWTISATGYNADSNVLVSGSKTFEFNNTLKTVYVEMSSFSGTGALQVDFKWDRKILNPVLEIRLEGNSISESEKYSPIDGADSYKFVKTGLSAGMYSMYVRLYNGTSPVVGTAESVQILNNRTTEGSINLSEPSGSTRESEEIEISSDTGAIISGHFSIAESGKLPTVLEANVEHIINFTLDATFYRDNKMKILWFSDGKQVGEPQALEKVNEFKFTPEIGNHIISIIIQSQNSENCGSISYPFIGKINAKKGSATYAGKVEVENTNNIILAPDTLIGALPDNHFITVTPSRSSMQVLSVFNNTVSVVSNRTYNATDFRFTWLSLVENLYSDSRMNFFILTTSENRIYVLQYLPASSQLDMAMLKEEPMSLGGFVRVPPCFLDKITTVSTVPSNNGSGSFFVFDSGDRSQELLGFTTSSDEINLLGTSARTEDMKNHICSDGYDSLLAVITEDGILHFANIKDGITTSPWRTYTDIKLQSAQQFKFLNMRFALCRTLHSLEQYEFFATQKIWVHRNSISTDSNDFGTSSDGAFIYIADKEGNLATYRSGLTDNFGRLYSQTVPCQISKMAVNFQHILGTDFSGNLYIFNIVQEDSSL